MRQLTPARNYAIARGSSGAANTSSSSFVLMPDMHISFTSTGRPIRVTFWGVCTQTVGTYATLTVKTHIDGSEIGTETTEYNSVTGITDIIYLNEIFHLPEGNYDISMYFKTSSGTYQMVTNKRILFVEEMI